jgi:phage host-nuclease inhibitor protein Gam
VKTKKSAVTAEELPEKAKRILEIEADIERVTAEREAATLAAAKPHDDRLKELNAVLKALLKPVEKCVRDNAATLFSGEDRSTVLGSVRVGLRFTPHAVAKGEDKWDDIAVKMHADGAEYVRLKPEVDRARMLADRTSDDARVTLTLGRVMTDYGLKFAQDEIVVIEKA